MWQQILDLPVIIQGGLGSALFWVAFEVCKRVINFSIDILARFSKNIKRELQTYDGLFHVRCMYNTDQIQYTSSHALSIFAVDVAAADVSSF